MNKDFISETGTLYSRKVVGYWLIGREAPSYIKFAIYKKPSRFHRFMTTLLLGWKWEEGV
jgi:hypothetical protein